MPEHEIIYIETGKYPLHCRVVIAQSKFWVYINEYIAELTTQKIIADRSQYICIKIAQIKPALSIINNKIKPHRVNP